MGWGGGSILLEGTVVLSERLLEGSTGHCVLALHRREQNEGQEAAVVFMARNCIPESRRRHIAVSVLLSVSVFAFCMLKQPLSEQSGTCLFVSLEVRWDLSVEHLKLTKTSTMCR